MTPVQKTKFKKALTKLNAHQLGAIDFSDIRASDKLLGSDRKNYLQHAHLLWQNPAFQNEIKVLIDLQKEFIACQADSEEQIMVGRGTINGAALLLERVQNLSNEYNESTKGEVKVDDPHSVIGEL